MATNHDDQQPRQQQTFYPAYCFEASPTHFTWVKMAAIDIHRLKRRPEFGDQGLFFYLNHPIRFVSLVGIVLARTDVPRRTILTVDDSSGATIDVVVLKSTTAGESKDAPQKQTSTVLNGNAIQSSHTTVLKENHMTASNETDLDISSLLPGTVVQVKGTLAVFRSVMQVQLERFFIVRETNAEMRFLEQRMRFLVEVLAVPWWLSLEEMLRLRGRADEKGRRIEEEQERSHRKRRRKVAREERDQRKILKMWEAEEAMRNREAEDCREDGVRFMREAKRKRFV